MMYGVPSSQLFLLVLCGILFRVHVHMQCMIEVAFARVYCSMYFIPCSHLYTGDYSSSSSSSIVNRCDFQSSLLSNSVLSLVMREHHLEMVLHRYTNPLFILLTLIVYSECLILAAFCDAMLFS